MNHLLEVRGELSRIDFKKCWNQTKTAKLFQPTGVPSMARNPDTFSKHLRENNMFVIQKKRTDEATVLYVSCRALNSKLSYLCVSFEDNSMVVEVRSEDPEILDLLYQGILFISN